MHLNIKKKLVKIYVGSVETQGCETQFINNTEKKGLETAEMPYWRRTKRMSELDRRKINEKIYKSVKEK